MLGRRFSLALFILTTLFILAAAGLGLMRHIERTLPKSTAAVKRIVRWERDGRPGHWLPTAYAYEADDSEPVFRWEWRAWDWEVIVRF